jgi:ComF family protein
MLPNLCVLCGAPSPGAFCMACDATFWNERKMRCRGCAVPLPGLRHAANDYLCDTCQRTPPSFDATLALADYHAPLDDLVRGLKFRAHLAIADEFAMRLARVAEDRLDVDDDWPDVVVPVPLSRQRLIARGYNQAWQIAKPLARALDVKADATLLYRTLHTAPQSRLGTSERQRNVAHAFALTRAVRGQHIALVDDVMTTGATLEALAHTLKAAGARYVTNFVVLRTAVA